MLKRIVKKRIVQLENLIGTLASVTFVASPEVLIEEFASHATVEVVCL